jgi:hypothetical protein
VSFWMQFTRRPSALPEWYEPIDPDSPDLYQVTFGGMYEVAAGMAAAGLLDEDAPVPELPNWESAGFTPERGQELFDFWVYPHQPGKPTLEDVAEPHERLAFAEFLKRYEAATGQPAPAGKALGYKFLSSDGWLVTPDECRLIASGLESALDHQRGKLVRGLRGRGYSRTTETVWDLLFWWARYNLVAADYGGYRIW